MFLILTLAAAALQMAAAPSDVTAAIETGTVDTLDDAADDPAFWLHPDDPAQSLILGTDKTAGLRIYDLTGQEVQFLPAGRLNNVDVRQGVQLADWSGDLAAASNRSDDTVVLFSVAEAGAEEIGRFSTTPEPYGFCLGKDEGTITAFVTFKQGYVLPFAIDALGEIPRVQPPLFLDSQLEGCVYDDATGQLYIGEEEQGIWSVPFRNGRFDTGALTLIDATGGATGLTKDVEGLTLYPPAEARFLVASSQGDDSFHVYRLGAAPEFVAKFRLVSDEASAIDGAQETDGIHAVSAPLGTAFPQGMLIVQDGFNVGPGTDGDGRTPDDEPRAPQNFKIIDWRQIAPLLK